MHVAGPTRSQLMGTDRGKDTQRGTPMTGRHTMVVKAQDLSARNTAGKISCPFRVCQALLQALCFGNSES